MSSVDILSAIVPAAPSAPAVSAGAGDAAAFRRAMDAAAGAEPAEDPSAPTPTPAPKKGFLHSGKVVEAAVAVGDDAPAVDVPAIPTPALAVAAAPAVDGAGEGDEPVASDDAAPVADAAAPRTDVLAPVVVASAPVAQKTAPAGEREASESDTDEGQADVERTLAALLDRILVETGASKDQPGAGERLEAAKAAVLDQAPPQVRAKLEAMLLRFAAAAAGGHAPATPVAEGETAAEAAPQAQTQTHAQAEANADAQTVRTVQTIQTALSGQTRRLTPVATVVSLINSAASVPAPRETGMRDEAALEVPAGLEGEASATTKPAGAADAPTSPNAGASAARSSASKAEGAPEPAASVQAEPAGVNPAAPADTAAGAPAAHTSARMVAAEAVRGSPETVAHLSAEILKKLEGRSTRFDMELHPADLGRVDVRLTIEADGRLRAQMAFDNPVAAADLRARADELRRSLEQAGFQLSDDSFSFAERGGDGRAFDDARQQFADGGRARARAFRAGGETADLADAAPVARRAVRLGVDVRI